MQPPRSGPALFDGNILYRLAKQIPPKGLRPLHAQKGNLLAIIQIGSFWNSPARVNAFTKRAAVWLTSVSLSVTGPSSTSSESFRESGISPTPRLLSFTPSAGSHQPVGPLRRRLVAVADVDGEKLKDISFPYKYYKGRCRLRKTNSNMLVSLIATSGDNFITDHSIEPYGVQCQYGSRWDRHLIIPSPCWVFALRGNSARGDYNKRMRPHAERSTEGARLPQIIGETFHFDQKRGRSRGKNRDWLPKLVVVTRCFHRPCVERRAAHRGRTLNVNHIAVTAVQEALNEVKP